MNLLGIRIIAGLFLLAFVAGMYAWWADNVREQGRMEVRAEWAQARERQKDAALREAAANAAETERRLKEQQDAQDAHDQALAAALADAMRASVAADGLRRQLARFTAAAGRPAGHSAAVGDSPPASAALDLLAELLSRADDEAGILAAALDRSHAAGQQCERAYDALTAPQ